MKRLFLLEDDLSLISGLSFAVKKQGYEIDAARTWRLTHYGQMVPMIWLFWM